MSSCQLKITALYIVNDNLIDCGFQFLHKFYITFTNSNKNSENYGNLWDTKS